MRRSVTSEGYQFQSVQACRGFLGARDARPAALVASTAGQLFFEVWVMKGASCVVTFVLLHVGQLTLLFSRSERVMVSSNGFRHFSQMNAYLGMAVTSPVSMLRVLHSSNVSTLRSLPPHHDLGIAP